MLKIRLQRVGRIHEPVFRLVLTDSKNSTKSGRFLEILGHFDSRKSETAEFKGERITYWMSQGAQVSDTVHNLLVTRKIITGKKINALPKKQAPKVEVVETPKEPTPTAPLSDAAETPKETAEETQAEVVETPSETIEATV